LSAGLVAAIAGLLGVVVTAVGGYLIARRKASGTIDTTEAETLWEQSNALLDRYKADLEITRSEVVLLKAEVIALSTKIRELENRAAVVARKMASEAAVRLAANAAEVLSHPATGTPADTKARAEALNVARALAAQVAAQATQVAAQEDPEEDDE